MNNRELAVKGIGKAAAAPDLIVLNMNLEVTEPEEIDVSDTAMVVWSIE